jgi:hypothetical protein
VETIVSIVALLCGGLCCLMSLAGVLAAIWILTRGTTGSTAAGEQRAAVSPSPARALSTTPPDPRISLGRPREPAAETAILPTAAPQSPSLRAAVADLEGEEADMETVVASPAGDVAPTAVPPLAHRSVEPARSAETPHPPLPESLEDKPPPGDPKKTPGPRSSGQTIIAFDDDDEDW